MIKKLCIACLVSITTALYAAPSIDQWQWRYPLPDGNSVPNLVWANNTFYAPCGDGLLRSADGTNWTLTPVQAGERYINGLAFGCGIYVAVGRRSNSCDPNPSPTLFTSGDGLAWVDASAALPSDLASLESVTYANGLFVAGGMDIYTAAAILTSPDGTNWARQPVLGYYDVPRAFVAGGRFFASAQGPGGAQVLTSVDATNWAATDAPLGGFWDAVYAKGLFVAGGVRGTYTSSNGTNWTQRWSGTTMYGLAYGGGTFVASGSSGRVVTSQDGLTWYQQNSGTTSLLRGPVYGNGTFVAAYTGVVLVSSHGTNWASVTPGWVVRDLYGITAGAGSLGFPWSLRAAMSCIAPLT